MYNRLFFLVISTEGNALITGLPGTGKTSLIKWSLRDIPPDFAVVVYDTAGDFQFPSLCDYSGRFPVNPLDLPAPKVIEILEESLAATYGEYPYLLTPAMAELLHRAIERGYKTLGEIRQRIVEIAESHEMDTAYAVKRRLVHFATPQFEKTDIPIKHGRSVCVDVSQLDRVGRLAFVLTHLELTRGAKNVIYVIDEAHRFLAFANRYSLLTDHLRTGRALGRFFVLVSHSYREFTRHLGYIKMIIRFPDWDMDETKMTPLQPSEALVTIRAASLRSMEALGKYVPLRGTWGQFRMTVPPYAAGSPT